MSSITHSCSMEPEFYTFPTSRFFQEERADALPSPSEIRALNRQSGDIRAEEFYRPTPARLPSLDLIVKYGAGVIIHEAKTQIMLREKLSGQVPIPEVFGWTTEGGQVFIYMQLMDGETLQARWHLLDEEERISLCAQLKSMVDCWRRLPQDGFIGSPGRQPLNDIFFQSWPQRPGPFEESDAVAKFQRLCGIDIALPMPIVFSHGDLLPPNIIVSTGPKPAVTAVIDWAQAGWYPGYWEYCKSRRIGLDVYLFEQKEQDEWLSKYLPLILDRVDDETVYYPWLYFFMSKGV